MRAESARLFTRDLARHPGRYLPAALPRLPFPDDDVDLVLSSHLLFTYADRFDTEFHLAGLQEMVRVSRGEVRVYPLVDQAGRPLPDLVDFQRGATSMLRLRVPG